MRAFGDVLKASAKVRPFLIGEWIEIVVDLENLSATADCKPRIERGTRLGVRGTTVDRIKQKIGEVNLQQHARTMDERLICMCTETVSSSCALDVDGWIGPCVRVCACPILAHVRGNNLASYAAILSVTEVFGHFQRLHAGGLQ